jgi:aromatic-L-amino-acid/L-tryptophan decarboxylase
MTNEEFRAYAHRVADWIADYRETAAERPVLASTAPGDVKRALPAAPPQEPEPFDALLRDLDDVIVPGLTHWQHPRFFGYFPSVGLPAAVLADFVSTGLGALGLSWQSSPALTEVEEVACDWARQMFGLSDAWSGVIQDTASTSTLVALICARERATDHGAARGGLQDADAPLVVYHSAMAHSSVDKAALLAGFGRARVRQVPVDDAYAMRADALAEMMARDAADALTPCAVVATTGTTTSTAMDPVGAAVEVARRHGAWVHVDAAMAGNAMILPECRWMWDGVEGADSLVVNPHKWLGVSFDCSLYYVRDPEHLVRVMSTSPSYLRTAADAEVKNLRDWGIPLGRRFRALKLWAVIREQGVSGLQARLRRDLENARWLEREIRAEPEWRVLAPAPLQTLCVRHEPPGAGLDGAALDRHTLGWAERLNRSGEAYVTPATLDGRWMVRVSVGQAQTEREHVAALWDAMRRAAAAQGAEAVQAAS